MPTSVTFASNRTGTRLGLGLPADPHHADERRKFEDRVGVGPHEVAGQVARADRAAGQGKGDGLAHEEVEVVLVDPDLVPFLGVARDDAEPGLRAGFSPWKPT